MYKNSNEKKKAPDGAFFIFYNKLNLIFDTTH